MSTRPRTAYEVGLLNLATGCLRPGDTPPAILAPSLLGRKDATTIRTDRAMRWERIAREKQRPPAPGEWRYWVLKPGRGWGKNRTVSEHISDLVERGIWRRFMLVHRTIDDAVAFMIRGSGGLETVADPSMKPVYRAKERTLVYPNGAEGRVFSAERPNSMRGPDYDGAWCDEWASWPGRPEKTLEILDFGVRQGAWPHIILTFTPKPRPFVRALIEDPLAVVVHGTMMENRANLADSFVRLMEKRYHGTKAGRQELEGIYEDTVEGALWTLDQLSAPECRIAKIPEGVELSRLVIGVDPSVAAAEDQRNEAGAAVTDEAGIVAWAQGTDSHYYLLEDASILAGPLEWSRRVVEVYRRREADAVVGEINNGGDLVRTVIHQIDRDVTFFPVTASRGKITRAQPCATLYSTGVVHHVGYFDALEEEMTHYTGAPGQKSPNRFDAMVWGLAYLSGAHRSLRVGSAGGRA